MPPDEFVVGEVLVRVYASRVDLPGIHGWAGVWAVYRVPRQAQRLPLQIGDTAIEDSELLAFSVAKAIAISFARSI